MNEVKKYKSVEIKGGECLAIDEIFDYLDKGPEAISKFDKEINKKIFRVKDTGLSSRVINYLEKESVLNCRKRNELSWRKFSFKELFYLEIIKELRLFGFENRQMKLLKENFFSNDFGNGASVAINMVIDEKIINLVVMSDGTTTFYDEVGMEYYMGTNQRSYIIININEIYNDIKERLGDDRVVYKDFMSTLSKIFNKLDKKEQQIINMIRSDKYQQIAVRKKDDGQYIINATNTSINGKEKEEVIQMLKDGDFFDMNIKRRDGRFVYVKKADSTKI